MHAWRILFDDDIKEEKSKITMKDENTNPWMLFLFFVSLFMVLCGMSKKADVSL